jgi:hypothetical protein
MAEHDHVMQLVRHGETSDERLLVRHVGC